MSCAQKAGEIQIIKIADKYFENAEKQAITTAKYQASSL
jgi:hypothetical protein